MPELLEVEAYRTAAEAVVGRRITSVDAPDAWFLKRGTTAETLGAALVGRRVTAARRHGKLLLVDTDGPVLGLRFGMTGRLVVSGAPGIGALEYGPARLDPAWDRLVLRLSGRQSLRVNDPRRLGGAELDPDRSGLGEDATTISAGRLAATLRSSVPVKARLLDQAAIAGIGNLLADEALWRSGIHPARPARSLAPDEVRRLHRAIRRTLAVLGARGGSHTGDLQPERRAGGRCPRDGTPLERLTVGGRTSYACPAHQPR